MYLVLTIQVAWLGPEDKMTWEPASSLAQALVDDYERGVTYCETTETETSYGVISHKLTVSECDTVEPQPKRRKYQFSDEHGYAHMSMLMFIISFC